MTDQELREQMLRIEGFAEGYKAALAFVAAKTKEKDKKEDEQK